MLNAKQLYHERSFMIVDGFEGGEERPSELDLRFTIKKEILKNTRMLLHRRTRRDLGTLSLSHLFLSPVSHLVAPEFTSDHADSSWQGMHAFKARRIN